MNIIDFDKNDFIEYEEFLRAVLNKEKIITKNNLEISFKLFDIYQRGKINTEELQIVLGKENNNMGKDVWQKIIDEADVDKDGYINFNDFKTIMEQC